MAGGMDRRPFRSASLAERTRRTAPPVAGAPPVGGVPAGAGAPTVAGAPAVAGAPTVAGVPSVTGAPPVVPVAATSGTTTAGSPARRHCWVNDGTTPRLRAPGLLVEWRQLGGAWQGRVAYVVVDDGAATLVEAWLPASQLERATEA